MENCPVCYENFAMSPPEVVARKLPCDHVACTQCLEDCFEGGSERRDKAEPVRKTAIVTVMLMIRVCRITLCCARESGNGTTVHGVLPMIQ